MDENKSLELHIPGKEYGQGYGISIEKVGCVLRNMARLQRQCRKSKRCGPLLGHNRHRGMQSRQPGVATLTVAFIHESCTNPLSGRNASSGCKPCWSAVTPIPRAGPPAGCCRWPSRAAGGGQALPAVRGRLDQPDAANAGLDAVRVLNEQQSISLRENTHSVIAAGTISSLRRAVVLRRRQ